MPGYSPEEQRERRYAGSDEDADPYCAPEEELLDVWLADAEGAERSRLGLAEEDKDGVEFVLV